MELQRLSRRSLLKLMGAGVAAVGLAACAAPRQVGRRQMVGLLLQPSQLPYA